MIHKQAKIKMNQPGKVASLKTPKACFEEFVADCKVRNLSKATIRNYTQQWEYFTAWWSGKDVERITTTTVTFYIAHLQTEDRAPETINTALRSLRTILHYFSAHDYCAEVKIKLLKKEEKLMDPYSDEELLALLKRPDVKKCGFREFRTWTVINFLLGTGIRANSLINIKIGDLDLDNNLAKINAIKTRKIQMLPLPPSLVSVLAQYLRHRGGSGDDYLFCSESGERMLATSIYHDVQRYNASRGVEKCGLHLFRHTFASRFIKSGGDPMRLQRLLGHATLDMANRYVRLFDTDLRDSTIALNPLEQLAANTKKITMKDKNKK